MADVSPVKTPGLELVFPVENVEKAQLTETGLVLPADLPYGEWLSIMGRLFQLEKATWWAIGDGLVHGEQKYGERYAQALALSEATGINVDSIRKAQWVSERVSVVRRRTNLSWSHHQEVASQEPEVQERILAIAEENELNVRETRDAVKRYTNALANPEAEDDEEVVPRGTSEAEGADGVLELPGPTDEEAAEIEKYGKPEDVMPDLDPYEEWERADKQNEELHEIIESMQTDDKAAEIRKLHARIAGLEGRLAGETGAKNAAVKQVKYYQRLVSDIKDALGVEENREIKPKLLQLLRRCDVPLMAEGDLPPVGLFAAAEVEE